MSNSREKEPTSISHLWLQGSSRALHLHCLTNISCQRRAGGMKKAKRCSHSDAHAAMPPTASLSSGHTDEVLAAKLRVAEFLSKGNSLREEALWIESYAICKCIYMYTCTCMYVSVGDAVLNAVALADSWQVVAVRVWLLLPGERKPPAFSAGLAFTEDRPWKRLGSIRIVNLIISGSLNHVMIEQVLQKRFSFS